MGTAPAETAPTLRQDYSPQVPAPSPNSPGRAGGVLTWVGVVIAFLVTLELTCRVEEWVMYRTPMLSRYTQVNDLLVRDADGVHGRANAQFQKWSMNGLGVRGPAARVVPQPGTVRVITIGASETFGMRESPGREYPRQLEDSLNARAARVRCSETPTTRFEVLNAGFAGMTLPTAEQDMRNRLARYRPAIVTIYPSPAQYLEGIVPTPARPDSTAVGSRMPAHKALRPRVIDRVREQVKLLMPDVIKARVRERQRQALLHDHSPGWPFAKVPEDRLAEFDNHLRQLVGTIRQLGATPILVTHGNLAMGRSNPDPYSLTAWESLYPKAPRAVMIGFDSAARATVLRIGADSGVVTADAAERLSKAPAEAYGDFVHFTDLGASHMADLLADSVVSAALKAGRCTPAVTASRSGL
jgi:hypothetical protein